MPCIAANALDHVQSHSCFVVRIAQRFFPFLPLPFYLLLSFALGILQLLQGLGHGPAFQSSSCGHPISKFLHIVQLCGGREGCSSSYWRKAGQETTADREREYHMRGVYHFTASFYHMPEQIGNSLSWKLLFYLLGIGRLGLQTCLHCFLADISDLGEGTDFWECHRPERIAESLVLNNLSALRASFLSTPKRPNKSFFRFQSTSVLHQHVLAGD